MTWPPDVVFLLGLAVVVSVAMIVRPVYRECRWRIARRAIQQIHREWIEKRLGYGYVCPHCKRGQDEGRKTGVYWNGVAVCGTCAPKVRRMRKMAEARARRAGV